MAGPSDRRAKMMATMAFDDANATFFQQIEAAERRRVELEHRADVLEVIGFDQARTMRVRQRALRRAAHLRFVRDDGRELDPRAAARDARLEMCRPVDDRAPLAITTRLPAFRRRTCGARRRPGARRASSRSTGGGDPDSDGPGEPAARRRGHEQYLADDRRGGQSHDVQPGHIGYVLPLAVHDRADARDVQTGRASYCTLLVAAGERGSNRVIALDTFRLQGRVDELAHAGTVARVRQQALVRSVDHVNTSLDLDACGVG
jgi:hypothetical protein